MVAASTVAAVGGGVALLYSAYSLFWWYEGEKCEKPKYEVKRVLLHSSQSVRLRNFDEVEVRVYTPYIIAEATIRNEPMRRATSKGFMQVARYIFGDNTKKGSTNAEANEKVAMTSPVRMALPDDASEKIPMTAPVQMEVESTSPRANAGADAGAPSSPKAEAAAAASPEAEACSNDCAPGETYKISFVMPSKYDMDTLPVPKDSSLTIREVPAHEVAVHTSFGSQPKKERIQEIATKLRGHVEAAGLKVEGDVMLYSYHPPFAPSFLRRNEVVYKLTSDCVSMEPGTGGASGEWLK